MTPTMLAPRRLWMIALLAAWPAAWAADALAAFPPAEPGAVRHVLQLPAREDEDAWQVELQVGRQVDVDGQNRYFFAGRIESRPIPGWGYTRYVVATLGPMAGTLMAIDTRLPKVSRFVTLGGEPMLLRYNSRLPLVVYVPEGAEVRYRLWRAEPVSRPIDKG